MTSVPDLAQVRPKVKDKMHHETLSGCLTESAAGALRLERLPEVDALVVHDILSTEECARLCAAAEELHYTFWNQENPEHARPFRSADTVEVTDPATAATLYARLRPLLPEHMLEIELDESDARCERGIAGHWRLCGINEVLLFAKYGPADHFSPHCDGSNVHSFNKRSLYSLLFYLNTCPDGGATRMLAAPADPKQFCKDEGGRFRWAETQVLAAAPTRSGTALAFSQDLFHEGEPVGPGCSKIIIRTDLMYERVPPLCDSEAGRQAFLLFREAELAEADGDTARASTLYRKGMRLCPELADVLGM